MGGWSELHSILTSRARNRQHEREHLWDTVGACVMLGHRDLHRRNIGIRHVGGEESAGRRRARAALRRRKHGRSNTGVYRVDADADRRGEGDRLDRRERVGWPCKGVRARSGRSPGADTTGGAEHRRGTRPGRRRRPRGGRVEGPRTSTQAPGIGAGGNSKARPPSGSKGTSTLGATALTRPPKRGSSRAKTKGFSRLLSLCHGRDHEWHWQAHP